MFGSSSETNHRLRSEKSHQELGRRGFDSPHLQEGVFAVCGTLCSQLMQRRALLEVSHARFECSVAHAVSGYAFAQPLTRVTIVI